MTPRPARAEDIAALARLWHIAWHEAHAALVPAALIALRTQASFKDRLHAFGDALRCAGPKGAPLGLCVVQGGKVDQIFVDAAARGTGLARDLLYDGEARLAAGGTRQAILECLPENTRAIRFYEKCGWQQRGIEDVNLDTSAGPFQIPALVLTKELRPQGATP
ncbi:GNAT family N-acetyltransferase [Halovulum sp. GXIMD14793]